MSTPRTFRDAVAAFFRARPNTWVDGMTLRDIGGCYAWRTRVSDCRKQLGMNIENRCRKVGRRTVSEYRFIPAPVAKQIEIFS